jgi:hypothetical protein
MSDKQFLTPDDTLTLTRIACHLESGLSIEPESELHHLLLTIIERLELTMVDWKVTGECMAAVVNGWTVVVRQSYVGDGTVHWAVTRRGQMGMSGSAQTVGEAAVLAVEWARSHPSGEKVGA